MKSNFDAELQHNSVALNESDLSDEHIRALTAALSADPPADFTKRVMGTIRAERRKIALRHRILRFGSAVAAALVIVPMAAIVVPAMIRQEKNTDAVPSVQDSVLYDAVEEQSGDLLYSKVPAPEDNSNVDAPASGIMTTSEPGAEEAPAPEAEAVVPSTPTAAPDHMSRPQESPAGIGTTAETFATDRKYTMNALPETPAITVLRSVIGTEKLDHWLAKEEEIGEDAAKAIIRTFAVQREDFLTAAAALNLSFTQDELNELFSTPLTEE